MDAATVWGLVLTVVGTVASIWGAAISGKEARAARESATEAQRIRAQLVNQRRTSDLSVLKVHCERAVRTMEKYGPAASASSLKGVNPEIDASDVQRLILEASGMRDSFNQGQAETFVQKVTPLLQLFVSRGERARCKPNGQAVLMEVSNFLAVVRSTLDEKRERTDLEA
jgi:hypothetical protein